MASEIQQLHFLLIPLMSQSHIIPLTDFAKLLANRGLIVSIITTPLNAIRYESTIEHAIKSGMRIQMIPLQFPGQEFGLPKECENMDSLTSLDLVHEFFAACEMLKSPLEKLIKELKPKPSCIVSTNALPWTQQLATEFNIPRYVFETISCFTLLCHKNLSDAANQESEISESEPFLVPDIPHKIEFTMDQLPKITRNSSHQYKGIYYEMSKAKHLARGTLVNSFEELEPWYVEGIKTERQNLLCIGPVSLCNKTLIDKCNRGNNASIECITWLDSMKPKSVIYACFGSLCHISFDQIKEIGLGLEESNLPFIWVVRKQDLSVQVEDWFLKGGYEQRVRGKGLIIRGWAPQILILSHLSIGGFLTHCGWNSTLEGVSAGVPMVTWPMFAEQFYNEKFIVHVLKIGVRVGVEQINAVVKRDQVKKSIEKLMVETEDGKERRERAQKVGEMAMNALEQGGSSNFNISLLIQDVMQQQSVQCNT